MAHRSSVGAGLRNRRCDPLAGLCLAAACASIATCQAAGIRVTASIETPTYEGVAYDITGNAVYTAIPFPVKGALVTVSLRGSVYTDHTITDGTYAVSVDAMPIGVHTAQVSVTDSSVNGTTSLVIHVVSEDQDDDGMLDAWEQAIVDADPGDDLATIYDVEPGDDFDSDGISNIGEWISGTDATDPTNLLAVASAAPGPSGPDLGWESVTGRWYTVVSTPSLAEPTWMTNLFREPGTGTGMSYTATNAEPGAVFLRLVVEKQ